MTTETVLDTLASEELGVGLGIGVIALALLLVSTARRPSAPTTPPPVAGLLLAIGGAGAIELTSSLPGDVMIGLVLLAVAGQLARRRAPLGLLLVLPGAAFVAAASPDHPRWVPVAVIAATALGSVGAASFDRRYAASGLGPALLGLSVVGGYLAVPETQAILALVGVAVPLALAGWPLRLVRLGDAGAFAAVGLFAWVVVVGGSARPSAVIGGLACLGLLVVEPTIRVLRTAERVRGDEAVARGPRRRTAIELAALHAVVVVLVARVAGLSPSTSTAVGVTAIVALGAGSLVLWQARRERT